MKLISGVGITGSNTEHELHEGGQPKLKDRVKGLPRCEFDTRARYRTLLYRIQ